jgi:hypothetical protein
MPAQPDLAAAAVSGRAGARKLGANEALRTALARACSTLSIEPLHRVFTTELVYAPMKSEYETLRDKDVEGGSAMKPRHFAKQRGVWVFFRGVQWRSKNGKDNR